jgi:L-2-hydroxyglutarate oxidase LhgO
LLGLCSFFLIPEAWYEVIEEFETHVHQFKHIPLFLKDGSPLPERFYAMNIRQSLVDVADKERSTAPLETNMERLDRPYLFLKTADSPKAKVYFLRERVANHHLWVPREILVYYIAMSNELFERISQLGGMDTINTLQIEEI